VKAAKKALLTVGLGQRYFELWWRYRCPFAPLPPEQIRKGFYFVHIPKTAGTSVLNALRVAETPYTHCPARIIRRQYPQAAAHLRFVTVVRDPYDRFASSFEYITKRSDWPAQRQFAREVIGDMSFAQFTQRMARSRAYRNLITGYEFFFPQRYFTHDGGQPLVHDVLRFETLAKDFASYAKGTDAALPSLRNHGGAEYKAMYDDASRALVRQIYAQDFRTFGYSTSLKA
jgi:hypothetical protein